MARIKCLRLWPRNIQRAKGPAVNPMERLSHPMGPYDKVICDGDSIIDCDAEKSPFPGEVWFCIRAVKIIF